MFCESNFRGRAGQRQGCSENLWKFIRFGRVCLQLRCGVINCYQEVYFVLDQLYQWGVHTLQTSWRPGLLEMNSHFLLNLLDPMNSLILIVWQPSHRLPPHQTFTTPCVEKDIDHTVYKIGHCPLTRHILHTVWWMCGVMDVLFLTQCGGCLVLWCGGCLCGGCLIIFDFGD